MNKTKYLGTLELSNGDCYETIYNESEHQIEFGTVFNAGFAPMYSFECEDWMTLEQGLQNAYEQLCETLNAF